MEERKEVNAKKSNANGLVLAILFIAAVVIAFMWVAIYNLNGDNGELQNRIEESRKDTEILKGQVLLLQDKLEIDNSVVSNKTSNEVSNEVENEVSNETTNEVSNETSNETSNEVSNKVENTLENKVTNSND